MKPRNPTLYRNLKQFTEEAINLIQEKVASPDDIPTRPAYELKIREAGGWSMSQVEKPDRGLLIHRHEPELEQLDSYASSMHLLEVDTVIAPHLDQLVGIHQGGATIVRTSQILPNFITALLSRSESLSPNREQFDALYRRMEHFFYSAQLNVRLIAPLINVKGPSQPTLLTDNISIAPNSANRLERWISDALQGFPRGPWDGIPGLTHSLEHQFTAPKVIGGTTPPGAEEAPAQAGEPPLAVAVNRIKQMVSALRLSNHDYVAVPFIEHQLVEWHPISPRGAQAPLYPPHWRTFGPRYELGEDDASEIASLYRALSAKRNKAHRFIDRAVHRVVRSVDEIEPGERLVDLVIALESLLLHDTGKPEDRGELTFRFALRGAYFLAGDVEQRRKLYHELREAYRLRSRIVHGSELPSSISILSETIPVKQFVGRIENHAREGTKRLLLLSTQPNAPKQLVSWNDLVLGFPPTSLS